MARKTPFNLIKFQEIQEQHYQDYRDLARRTKDPAIKDLANFLIRDTQDCTKIHLQRLKFKIKK